MPSDQLSASAVLLVLRPRARPCLAARALGRAARSAGLRPYSGCASRCLRSRRTALLLGGDGLGRVGLALLVPVRLRGLRVSSSDGCSRPLAPLARHLCLAAA